VSVITIRVHLYYKYLNINSNSDWYWKVLKIFLSFLRIWKIFQILLKFKKKKFSMNPILMILLILKSFEYTFFWNQNKYVFR
jgi:hypothetical protein